MVNFYSKKLRFHVLSEIVLFLLVIIAFAIITSKNNAYKVVFEFLYFFILIYCAIKSIYLSIVFTYAIFRINFKFIFIIIIHLSVLIITFLGTLLMINVGLAG